MSVLYAVNDPGTNAAGNEVGLKPYMGTYEPWWCFSFATTVYTLHIHLSSHNVIVNNRGSDEHCVPLFDSHGCIAALGFMKSRLLVHPRMNPTADDNLLEQERREHCSECLSEDRKPTSAALSTGTA